MASYNNINEYRQKKKRKQIIKKCILAASLVAILILLIFVIRSFKGDDINNIFNKDKTPNQTFPLSVQNEQLVDIVNIGTNFGIVTKTNILSYSLEGKKVNTYYHGYSNPVVKESGKKILTYDRAGMKFRVDSSANAIGEKTLSNQILCGVIANNGNTCIISKDEQHASILTVYDNKLNEIYKYYSNEILSTVAFSPDSKYVLTSAVKSSNGIVSTTLYKLNTTDNEDIEEKEIENSMGISVALGNDQKAILISNKNISFYDFKTKGIIKQEAYKEELLKYIITPSNEVIFMFKNSFNNQINITLYSPTGEVKANNSIDSDIVDFYCDGARLVILSKKTVYDFDMSLTLIENKELTESFNKIIYNGDTIFLMSNNTISKDKVN